MNNLKDKIEEGYLFGFIKYKNDFKFYLMPIAYWILNYKKYDPTYNPNEWDYKFRDNILNVNNSNIGFFIEAIKVDLVDFKGKNEIMQLQDVFSFYIDFDSNLFVSYFDEISLEDYLPDENWVYKYENPQKYLPPVL